MAESSQPTVPSQPGGPVPGAGTAGAGSVLTRVLRALGSGLLALAAVVTGSLVFGLLAGFIWQLVARRPLFVVVGRGAADVVNPETGAFIAADGWFCVLAVAGGIVTGLLGYRFAVRRYGPLPMVGVLAGGLAAAFVTRWVGQRSGSAAFNARLGAARPGTLLHAPIMLGSAGALALRPLAAGRRCGGAGQLSRREQCRRAAAATVAGSVGPVGGVAGPGPAAEHRGIPAARDDAAGPAAGAPEISRTAIAGNAIAGTAIAGAAGVTVAGRVTVAGADPMAAGAAVGRTTGRARRVARVAGGAYSR